MTSSFRNHYNYLFRFFCFIRFSMSILVGPSGLEPPTSCLSGTRSNLLSYEPMWLVWCFTLERFLKSSLSRSENFTLALPKFHSPKANFTLTKSKFHCKAFGFAWWRWWDSNPWPPACRAGALPAELHPRYGKSHIYLRKRNLLSGSSYVCQHWTIFPYSFP